MSEITLYTDSRFPCPQRLALVIHELGIKPKNIQETDILKSEHKTPEFLKLNPSGAVPCIRDDQENPPLHLSESRAIARYLAHRYRCNGDGLSVLVPDFNDPVALAKFEEGASIELTAFDATANRLVFEEYFKPTYFHRDPDRSMAESLRVQLGHVFDTLEQRLKDQPFMAGQELTVVDLFYLPYMFHLTRQVWQSCLEDRPRLQSWWSKMTKLGAFQAVLINAVTK
ncbi:glutathione S-transferase [Talaromyces proteolyticus]|uniref:glutathione transferase n=1 Tax=Talaromyces proteolyticus TaxID=1131652 RepID=A0AAD4KEV5_9EURO|nr:glutathione S-transferase [Talaromyces proteolyticus]KAH8689457.1 glutathione S-transferase [Talaromyces proteolyticus]